VPMISMAASAKIVEPMDDKRKWVFKTPQNDIQMSLAIASHMKDHGVRTVGFIGFADAYGEGWYNEFSKAAALKGITVVANERFARNDSSVTAQVLKIQAAKPDAVLVAGSGTPAALPQITLKERGYTGLIYQTHGVANADFLRVGGKNVEGTFLPAGPVLVARQLPATNPVRASATETSMVGSAEATTDTPSRVCALVAVPSPVKETSEPPPTLMATLSRVDTVLPALLSVTR